MQRGSSFECATLLASLLLGQGYDAYVASGYASREQVDYDLSRRSCPYLPRPEEPQPPAEPRDSARYRVKPPPELRSRFLAEMEARERRRALEEIRRREEERLQAIAELEKPPPDEYHGQRVHAWVVVLPDRGGERWREEREPFFVEPSSGESYDPASRETGLLYTGVESVWNDENYWVNVQQASAVCELTWDLKDVSQWEHVLPGEPDRFRDVLEEEAEEDVAVERDKHLDMPVSYVEALEVHSLDFERRYPNGHKNLHYKKARVDLYAAYVQMDGLVERVTVYEDYEYREPLRVCERYAHRADHLVRCERDATTDRVVDFYERGRADACKEHRYHVDDGGDAINAERTLDFYDVVRLDGLSRLEMHPSYLAQHYSGREDYLYHRHVQFAEEKESHVMYNSHMRQIWKITEKYNRNEAVPASKDIAIREFAIGENEIRLKYHYEQGHCTRATRTFRKPPASDRGDRLAFVPEMTQGYNPDPLAPPDKSLDLFRELARQLSEEERSLSRVRDAESEVAGFLRLRASEHAMPRLVVSPFDANRNEAARVGMFAKEEMLRAQSQREVEEDADYLGPYLARLGNPEQLTKAQAQLVRRECLEDLKQRLLERANRVLRDFEELGRRLRERQERFTRLENVPGEEEERIVNEINEMTFELHTLEVRMNRCRELAPERYKTMLHTLKCDPRLAVLYG